MELEKLKKSKAQIESAIATLSKDNATLETENKKLIEDFFSGNFEVREKIATNSWLVVSNCELIKVGQSKREALGKQLGELKSKMSQQKFASFDCLKCGNFHKAAYSKTDKKLEWKCTYCGSALFYEVSNDGKVKVSLRG